MAYVGPIETSLVATSVATSKACSAVGKSMCCCPALYHLTVDRGTRCGYNLKNRRQHIPLTRSFFITTTHTTGWLHKASFATTVYLPLRLTSVKCTSEMNFSALSKVALQCFCTATQSRRILAAYVRCARAHAETGELNAHAHTTIPGDSLTA